MSASQRPNILLIITDQQSASAISCAGNEHLHTPAVDALAAQGVRFDNAYCTYPLCTPARASMFTGRWPHEVGIGDNNVGIAEAFREQELGNLLSAAGYTCAYGGKWHVPEIAMPEGHGFEQICGFDDVALGGCVDGFLRRDHGQPFFLVAGFDNPHNICEWMRNQPLPWGNLPEPPPVDVCPPLPANHAPSPDEPTAVADHRQEFLRRGILYDFTPEQWRRVRWAYFRLVERVDAQVGLILSALADNGRADDTVVIFTSDHGDHHGAHTLNQKWTFYEESARVPLIVRVPGGATGAVDRHLVTNGPELFRTVCDYAGVDVPDGVGGHSLRPLVEGRTVDAPNEYVVAESRLMAFGGCAGRMVRSERYKYCVYERGWPREELYDLHADPGETDNLAGRAAHAEALARHREHLRQWCTSTADNFCGGHYAHPDAPFMLPGDDYYDQR